MTKVSICIPTYENVEEVTRLIQSIESQTFQDLEIIITDDSRDRKIEEFIHKLASEKPVVSKKIRYFHNKTPLGHIFNWNEALSHATGEYVKIMFSDDWFTFENSLEKLVGVLESDKEAALAFCGNLQVSGSESYPRKPEKDYVEKLQKDYQYLFISNQIGAPSNTLYRNRKDIAFDEKSNWASDVFLYMEILKKNPKFVYIEEPLISIGIHENQYTESFSEKDERIVLDYSYMFQKYALQNNQECRQYFLERYLVRYEKGMQEALKTGYSKSEFRLAKLEYLRKEVIPSYGYAIKRRLRGRKQSYERYITKITKYIK